MAESDEPSLEEVSASQLSADEIREKSFLFTVVADPEAGPRRRQGSNNVFFAYLSVIKTIVGVGILGLPRLMREWGVLFSVLFLFLFACLCHLGTLLLIRAKNLSRHSNLSTIARALGRYPALVVYAHFAVLLNNFGICVAELTVFGRNLQLIIQRLDPQLHQEGRWYLSIWFSSLALLILMLPLFLFKQIQKLRYISLIGISAVTAFFVLQVRLFFVILDSNDNQLPFGFSLLPTDFDIWRAFSTIPNVMLAFLFQMNLFPIYKSMKDTSDAKIEGVALGGVSTCFVLYSLVGLAGYASFGTAIQDSNYLIAVKDCPQAGNSTFVTMNALFILNVVCSMPFLFFGAKNNFIALVELLFYQRDYLDEKESYLLKASFEQQFLRKKATGQYVGLTVLLLVLIYGLAVGLNNLGFIFNLVGALASNSIGFILPALLVILHSSRLGHFDSWRRVAIVVFCCFIPLGLFCVVCEIIAIS